MVDTIKGEALLGITAQEDGKEVKLTLKGADGAFHVVLPAAIVGSLVGGLLSISSRLSRADATEMMVQPTTLSGCRPAVLENGQGVLDLIFEGTAHLPVTFPRAAIPQLKHALDVIQRTATADPTAPPLTRN